jgi:hypothetical protein
MTRSRGTHGGPDNLGAGVYPSRRLAYWNEAAAAHLNPMSVRPFDLERFSGQMRRYDVGKIRAMEISSNGAHVERSSRHVIQCVEPVFLLDLQLRGGDLRQRHQTHTVPTSELRRRTISQRAPLRYTDDSFKPSDPFCQLTLLAFDGSVFLLPVASVNVRFTRGVRGSPQT